MPPFLWADSTVIAATDHAKLTMGSISQCTITTDAVAARADRTLCLVTIEGAPAEIVINAGTGLPTWGGTPLTVGSYPVVARVSQYDATDTAQTIGSVSIPLTVVDPASMVFTSPPTLSIQQYLGIYNITPTQTSGPACTLFADIATAAAKAATGVRACLFTWSSSGVDFVSDGKSLTGAIFDTTPVTNTWTLNIVHGDTSTVALGSGTTVVTPDPVTLTFSITPSPSAPTALITPVTLTALPTGTTKCAGLTSNAALAAVSSSRPCLIEFGAVDGLTLDTFSSSASLKGKLPTSPATTIPYTVSIFFKGTKRLIYTGSEDILSTPPAPPAVNFEYVRQISPDVFVASTTGGILGVITSETSQGELAGQYQLEATPEATRFGLFGSKRRQVAVVDPAPLYSSRQMEVKLAYAALPAVSTTRTVTVVSVPRDGLRLNLVGVGPVAADTIPFPVSATIGETTASGFQYVAANAGQWSVVFGEVALNGSFIPLTSPILTDASGSVSSTVSVAGKTLLRLAAQATPVSATGYTTTVTSRTQVVSVVKGTAIAGTITAMGPASGPAPYLAVLRVGFDTRADQLANQTVTWLLSSDGGATWATPPGATGVQYGARYSVGTYLVKVKFVNKNTLEESYSPDFTVQAYPVPKIAVAGPSYFLPGSVINNTASATDAVGAAIPAAIWEWELQRPVLGAAPIVMASGSTSTITYTPTESGIYRLMVKARDPATTDADTRAWGSVMRQIIVGAPTKPSVRIAGPVRVEVTKAATYTATAATAFDIGTSDLVIAGEWTLPNGSKVPGPSLNWTPSLADYAVFRTPVLTYTAWIVGYEAATTVSGTLSVNLWKYTWPTWRVTRTTTGTIAPANAQYSVLPDDPSLLSVLEGLTYEWTVPAGMRAIGTPTSKLTAIADYGGAYTVGVQVSDARGNVQSLSNDVVYTDPPPVVLDLAGVNMSKWSHSPISLGLTTKATGGHPTDGIVSWKYFVDGSLQTVPNQSTARLNLPDPGSFNVDVEVTTRMGATATKTITVVVPTNQAPTCAVSGVVATNRRAIALKSNCVDPDGAITNYKWFLNGTPISLAVGGSWTMILPTGTNLPVDVGLTVTDDGGLTANSSAHFE